MQWCSTGCLVASYHQSGNVGSGPRVAAGSSHTSARASDSPSAENFSVSVQMRRVHARAWMDFFRLGKRIKSFCHRTSLYHGPMVHWTIAWYERINALQINQLLPRICNTDLAATLGSFKIFPRNCLGLESSPNLFNMVCHRPTSPDIFLQVMQTLQLTKLATQPTVQSSVNP